MGFEIPLGLLGLLAPLAVLAAHLVRRRDLPRRQLPTVRLLARASARSQRRLRLRDLLLLALRMLAIASLALGLARPFAETAVSGGEGRVGALAIVLDDSMSMGARRGRVSTWERAREGATSAIERLASGSEVAVILAGRDNRILVHRTDDLELARHAIETVKPPASRGTDLAGAIGTASRILDGSHHPHRRLLVISDFDRSSGATDVQWPTDRVEVELLSTRLEGLQNRAILEASPNPDPLNPGTVSIRLKLRTLVGDDAVEVRLLHRDAEIARRTLPASEGLASGNLSAPLVDEGDPTATVEIVEADDLDLDDRAGVLLRPPASIRVVIVSGDRAQRAGGRRLDFLARALDASPGPSGSIHHRRADPHTLSPALLAETDVVVLSNAAAPEPALMRRLGQFVERGGGLLLAAGDAASSRAYSSQGRGLLPAHLGAADQHDPGLRLVDIDERILPTGGSLDATRTRRRLLLEPDPGAEILASFEDGAPALVLGRRGEGRVAVLATTLDDAWTSLPYYPSFVPFSVRLLELLAGESAPGPALIEAGAVAALRAPEGASGLEVVGPEGVGRIIDLAEGMHFDDTARAGPYRVRADGVDLHAAAFVVRAPSDESGLEAVALPTLEASDESDRGGLSARRRRPLASWFFLLAGLLLAVEGFVRVRPLRPLSALG